MKKLISLFLIATMTVPTTLLIISCGQRENTNIEVWIESNPNSPSLIGYQEAAKTFNEETNPKLKVEVKNVAKGNMERELMSSKYGPNIINGSIDQVFRVKQLRQEKIMSIKFDKGKAYNESFLEYGQDKDGNQLMIPIGKSFSVLLINKKLLKSLNTTIDTNKTGSDLVSEIWKNEEAIVKSLKSKDLKMLGIDDMSDLINLQYASEQKINTTVDNQNYFFNYYNDILYVNKTGIDKINPMMSELNKIHDSLVITQQNVRPSNEFKQGKLLMTTASSAGLNYYNAWKEDWKNDIDIINLSPKENNFMVQRGDGLIAFESKDSVKQEVTKEFINYLLDSSDIWKPSSTTGYIPWTKKELCGDFEFDIKSPQQQVLELVKNKDSKQFSIEANESSGLYNQFIFNELIVNLLLENDGWNRDKLESKAAKNAFANASKSRKWEFR